MKTGICLGLAGVLLALASGAVAEEAASGKRNAGCRPRTTSKRGLDLREPCPEAPAAAAAVPAKGLKGAPPDAVVKDMPPPAPAAGEAHWYGGETLLMDGIALGAMTVGVAMVGWDNSDASQSGGLAVFLAGGVTYLVAAPIIHATHDGLPPLVSVGLRVGLPILGGVVGAGVGDCGNDDLGLCSAGYAGLGIVLGMAAAIVVDASLAWEPGTAPGSGARVSPLIVLERGRSYFGATGTF